jgi:hypothetical protein
MRFRKTIFISGRITRTREWTSRRLEAYGQHNSDDGLNLIHKPDRLRLAVWGVMIFLTAMGIRLLHWQDNNTKFAEVYNVIMSQSRHYKQEAFQMIKDHWLLYPSQHNPKDTRILIHPPGYSILIRAFYEGNQCSHTYDSLRIGQVIADSIAAVLVFLFVTELLPLGVAIISGLFVALSPHLAYYSLWLTPDTLCVLPIILALYMFVRAVKRPRVLEVISAGAMIGLSCWLRSNAILLAPFLAVIALLLFEQGKRLRYSLALLISAIIVIAPITIRNYIVFHRFVPLSLATGANLIEGIAEFDKDSRFNMPSNDPEAKRADAEWYGRPDYANSPWRPDGIERDRMRISRGLEVIRSNPGWFLGVAFRRALVMLHYNGPRSHEHAFDTPPVFRMSAKPTFNHSLAVKSGRQPLWSPSPSELLADGTIIAPKAKVTLADSKQVPEASADISEAGDVFASAPIDVKKNTDYVLILSVDNGQGDLDFRVTAEDISITLGSAIDGQRYEEDEDLKQDFTENQARDSSTEQPKKTIQIPFASGNTSKVCLVISKTVESSVPILKQIDSAKLFALGATPYAWTYYPRALVRGIQRNLFLTVLLIPLFAAGIALLLMGGRLRELIIILSVPFYYICSHALFRTHYRYILPAHYFLFVMASVTLYFTALAIKQIAKRYGNVMSHNV